MAVEYGLCVKKTLKDTMTEVINPVRIAIASGSVIRELGPSLLPAPNNRNARQYSGIPRPKLINWKANPHGRAKDCPVRVRCEYSQQQRIARNSPKAKVRPQLVLPLLKRIS